MSRLSRTRLSKHSQLIGLLAVLVMVAAACSGSSDVEVEDASPVASDVPSEETDAEETDAEETDVASDEIETNAETEAMGEDENMIDEEITTEGDVGTTLPLTDQPDSELNSAELTAAFEAGAADRFRLPFMYLTVDQDCDGCAETMSLYYVPSEAKASILTLSAAYIDGVAQADFSAVDPSLQAGDPRRIAEQLANTDATYGIDPVTGAITSWTLDGNSVTMRCLQVDTRPVDMRTPLCENSVIG